MSVSRRKRGTHGTCDPAQVEPPAVRILVVGTGGVGAAFAAIARRRSFFEHCALADYDPARPEAVVAELDDGRFSAHRVDASSRDDVVRLIRETRADAVLNAVDPGLQHPDLLGVPRVAA